MLYEKASAALVDDRVLVRADVSMGPNNHQGYQLALTQEAAQSLLSDLFSLVVPPEPRFDIEVILDDNGPAIVANNVRYRRGSDWFTIVEKSGEVHFNTRHIRVINIEPA